VAVLKSLICIQGFDNGRRFLIISLLSYGLILISHPIVASAKIIYLLIAIISIPIMAASSLRRIRDAQIHFAIMAIPFSSFLLNLWGFASIDTSAKWWLIFPAILTTLIISLVGHANVKRTRSYHWGYCGPIKLDSAPTTDAHLERIEPKVNLELDETNIDYSQQTTTNNSQSDREESRYPKQMLLQGNQQWQALLSEWLNQYQKSILIALPITMAIFILIFWPSQNVGEQIQESNKTSESINYGIKNFHDKVKLPDQFWIMLDQNKALSIAWEGDIVQETQLTNGDFFWSAYNGVGDISCTNLHFSLGADIKSLLVRVNSEGDYYADFSPVDTQLIVKSIAEKDRFKLCGYEFSLKGTRKILQANEAYRAILKSPSN